MNDTTSERQPDRKIWERLLYMLFCAIAYSVAEVLIALVAIFQFVCVLVNGHVHERALRFGRNLATYAFQVFQFVTFNDERVPFPFSDWPDETAGDGPWRQAGSAPRDDPRRAAPDDVEAAAMPTAESAPDAGEAPDPGEEDRGRRDT
ncbi:MAG TPA: DUF4389 domain-containing protein [Pseudomonadales bacterium]|nr:DUF4389 domain-containing protein [Pseudomonadales bacterium]